MPLKIPFAAVSHSRKVCSLYKRALRCAESWACDRSLWRYQAVVLRERFDLNRNVTDPIKANQLLAEGEKELFEKQHIQPKLWPMMIGGNAYGRESVTPDWVLDYWHPLEKAQYPDYFATREKRKEEYIKMWEKEYGSQGHH